MGDFDSARATFGLGDGNLGVESVVDSATAVILGIFTTLAFGRVRERVSDDRLQQLTVMVAAVTMLVFTVIRVSVKSSVAHAMWHYSADLCRLFFQAALRLRTTMIFLLTHFLSSAVIQAWTEAQLSTGEALAVAWAVFTGIYFFVLLARKAQVSVRAQPALLEFVAHPPQPTQQ